MMVKRLLHSETAGALASLDERAREIFRAIVDSYLNSGDPVGSRNLSRLLPMTLSPASIRNVMQDLEALGLIYAPHASAGRLPTEGGLRFFVDSMLQIGDLDAGERAKIEEMARPQDVSIEQVLGEASALLSGLARGAGLVVTTNQDRNVRQIEFVRLDAARALAVLVMEDGTVENRVFSIAADLPFSALSAASNYLNARLRGRRLEDLRAEIEDNRKFLQAELDDLTARVVESGLAVWAGEDKSRRHLIVRGQAHLLEDLTAADALERIRSLFDDLETQNDVIDLLSRAETGEGVRIFIGSENKLFSMSGSAVIAAPFRDGQRRVVGVLGVIGPTRLNYARIVPMVDYTAKVLARFLASRG